MILPEGPGAAGLAAVAVALGLLALGYGLTGLGPGRRADPVARWALAFPAVVLYAVALTLVHLASGGALFASPLAVRAVTAAVALVLLGRAVLRRLRAELGPAAGGDVRLAVGCSLGVAAVWGSPVFRLLPLATSGDAAHHAGWTEQLLNGEPLPSAPLTGDVPNYYPWLFHALVALVTHLTPGGHAFAAFSAVQLLQVTGIAAALFGLGWLFAGRWAGAAVALLGSAAGGFGFVLVRSLDLVRDPRGDGGAAATEYLGDLLRVRSYNASFLNLVPPYPRDVAVALFAAALFALAAAAGSERLAPYAFAGVLLGTVGLTQFDPFLVGVLAAAGLALAAGPGRRLRTAAAVLLPALAVFALWALPLAVSYVRLGGFVDTTVVPPVTLPAWAVLGGWGIVTPLALAGAFRAARTPRDPVVRTVAAALAAGALAVAASALVPTLLGEGFETVGRQHRYWPLFALPLAVLAGIGAHWGIAALRRRSLAAAVAATGGVVALALPSPLVATLAYPELVPPSAPVTRALEGGSGHLLNALAAYGDGSCAVSAPHPIQAFAYAGVRLLRLGDPDLRANAARIRWAEVYERIGSEEARARDDRLVQSGAVTPAELRAIVRRWGLDVVVVPAAVASAEVYRDLDGRPVRLAGDDYVLFAVGAC